MSETKKMPGKKTQMANITINIPKIYDRNIEKLKKLKIVPSRSEAVRLALKEFLQREYSRNLEILGFFQEEEESI